MDANVTITRAQELVVTHLTEAQAWRYLAGLWNAQRATGPSNAGDGAWVLVANRAWMSCGLCDCIEQLYKLRVVDLASFRSMERRLVAARSDYPGVRVGYAYFWPPTRQYADRRVELCHYLADRAEQEAQTERAHVGQ